MKNMKVCGKIVNIKNQKNNLFMIINGKKTIQVVVKKNKIESEIDKINIGDVIDCKVIKDLNNNSKFKCKYDSYLLLDFNIISKNNINYKINFDKEKIIQYSETKYKIRKFLHSKGYIEVDLPVLTDGEISSKSKSFSTEYFKNNKRLYLRKTLDTFLRMYSCSNLHKTFSIGRCFRNEYLTSIDKPEFEMLSIFSNYISKEEAVKLALRLIKIITSDNINVMYVSDKEYKQLNPVGEMFYVISNYLDDKNSYCSTINSNETDEFKVKYKGVTIVHGVNEIYDYEEYISKIDSQGKNKDYGELKILERLINSGAPKCYNLGISIVRILALYNNYKIKDYDNFSFDRLGG